MNDKPAIEAVEKLREPFPPNQISKLPKESRAQTDERKANRNSAINCQICGGWHHARAVHLDYVGHAALTDRLLDTDIEWSWEPLAYTEEGLPALDRTGGLWIKLTVCGITRLGYGAADGKSGGDAVKEIIGDALRNAAMRFGAALDLWHKGDLHTEDDEVKASNGPAPRTKLEGPHSSKTALKAAISAIDTSIRKATTVEAVNEALKAGKATIAQAERDWPELIHGDPAIEEAEGLQNLVVRRRAELAEPAEDGMFAMLIKSMKENETAKSLAKWMEVNETLIGELDDAEGRSFQLALDMHESNITQMDTVRA